MFSREDHRAVPPLVIIPETFERAPLLVRAPAASCQDERRRQMSFAAAAAVPLHGRVACARLLHHSSPALEPQHSPNSSHSLLVQAT